MVSLFDWKFTYHFLFSKSKSEFNLNFFACLTSEICCVFYEAT